MTLTNVLAVIGCVVCIYGLMIAASAFVDWLAERESKIKEYEEKDGK